MTVKVGNLPEHYLRIQNRYPNYFQALQAFGKAAQEAGPIEVKTAHLIQLAAAAAAWAEGAVHSHARQALEAGATPEEIRHAVLLLSSTIGFPNVAAALSWVDDVIEAG